ncbi:hypothetical protein PVL30_003497 [Lodderomyces elongisporus]|uniref:uncharacterized protein n=1 Tax=Lodderomyces elongisporus TaxID=36914 RepID=UPI00291FCD9A|nr:uncharacterized protein PVL30_003497 [Lodderomyces elongisporus]WLF79733.1 hypothetical protein PVL30_003497 [Lodderomyces elongisporus]
MIHSTNRSSYLQDQNVMNKSTSAEAITKLLRSSTEPLDTIVKCAHKVLNNDFDIYFPDSTMFILSLLIDRLNDRSSTKSKFYHWKYEMEVWELLEQVLKISRLDVARRNRLIENLKLYDILIDLLACENTNHECLSRAFEITEWIQRNVYLEIEESTANSLLKEYLKYALRSNNEYPRWSSIIAQLYRQSWDRATQNGSSKKIYAKFMDDCLALFVKVVGGQSTESPALRQLFIEKAFLPEHYTEFTTKIERLLSPDDVTQHNIETLFSMAVAEISSKNVVHLEQLYVVLTSIFPELSVSLLHKLVDLNGTLSSKFVEELYTREIKDKKFIDLDWDMVKLIFQTNSELATSKSKFIFEKYNTAFNLDDKVLAVAKVVVDSYAKNRELVEFFTKIWPKVLKKDEVWETTEFVSHVASLVRLLSTRQLKEVLDFISQLDPTTISALSIAITDGLRNTNAQTVSAVKEMLLTNLKEACGESWHVHYNILCLYPDSNVNYLVSELSLKSLESDPYYYYVVFRLYELSKISSITNEQQDGFLKILNAFKDSDSSLVTSVTKRWFTVLNHCFSTENLNKLAVFLIKFASFKNIPDEFFEQQKFVTLVSKALSQRPEPSVILHFPVACIPKRIRKEIIDELVEQYFKVPSNDKLYCIKHLLKGMSLHSNLETKFEVLKKLEQDVNGMTFHEHDEDMKKESKELVEGIVSLIFAAHFKQIKDKESFRYISNVIESLLTSLSSDKFDMTCELEIVTIILKECTTDSFAAIQKLRETFISYCLIALNNYRDDKVTRSSMLQSLVSCAIASEATFEQITTGISSFDAMSLKDATMSSTLTKLIAKIMPVSRKYAIYFLGLLLINSSLGEEDALIASCCYFERQSMDVAAQDDIIAEFLGFLNQAGSVNSARALTIACALLNSSRKGTNPKLISKLIWSISTLNAKANSGIVSSILRITREVLSTKPYLFDQYGLENTIYLVSNIVKNVRAESDNNVSESIYVASTQVLSSILLYHRFQLTTRHHILMDIMTFLLQDLCTVGSQAHSVQAASAYSRLLHNMCEPMKRVEDRSEKHSTTTTTTTTAAAAAASSSSSSSSKLSIPTSSHSLTPLSNEYKKYLRRHVPILLTNYVNFQLKFNFDKAVNDTISSGIYSIFDVLSQSQLHALNAALDFGGRAFFKSLYNDYKEYGKWKG